MIAPHTDDARNYPIDMCWSVVKGLRVWHARQGHLALSRLLDRQEASFSHVHADKKKQRECGSAADMQMHSRAVRRILLSDRSEIRKNM